MTKIRDLETAAMSDDAVSEPASALGEWYLSIRDTEIESLEDEDLCRACRQGLFPDALVPIVLRRLEAEPLAGEMYDGEMLGSLTGVPSSYWSQDPKARLALRRLLALTREELDEDMAADVAKLESLST